MIELSLTEFCLLMLIAAFVLVGLFGWVSRFSHWNEERRGRRVRMVCDLCLEVWQDNGRERIRACPGCGRNCERKG